MPIPFLSDEWVHEVARRVGADDRFREAVVGLTATLQQVVTRPEGEVRYWIRITDGAIEVGPGEPAGGSDVTVSQDYATAVLMAKGELNPVAAFMTGRLRVDGSMGILMKLQGAVSTLPGALRGLDVEY